MLDSVSPQVPGIVVEVRASVADQVVLANSTSIDVDVVNETGEPFLQHRAQRHLRHFAVVVPVQQSGRFGEHGQGQGVSVAHMGPGRAERAMYFDAVVDGTRYNGGHDAFGSVASSSWYLSEGNVLPDFSQFITIANPDPTTSVEVQIRYDLERAAPISKTVMVAAGSRRTVQVYNANDQGGIGRDVSDPVSRGVSAVVSTTSAKGIVVERPLYMNRQFPGLPSVVNGGTVHPGANGLARTVTFAEGTTLPGFDEFLTISNPGAAQTVTITYFTDQPGEAIPRAVSLPAGSRTTTQVFGESAQGGLGLVRTGVATTIVGAEPFMAERPIYVRGTVAGIDDVSGASVVVGTPAG